MPLKKQNLKKLNSIKRKAQITLLNSLKYKTFENTNNINCNSNLNGIVSKQTFSSLSSVQL